MENVLKSALVHGDGTWIDGDGPDNGAWMCEATYYKGSPLTHPEALAAGAAWQSLK